MAEPPPVVGVDVNVSLVVDGIETVNRTIDAFSEGGEIPDVIAECEQATADGKNWTLTLEGGGEPAVFTGGPGTAES